MSYWEHDETHDEHEHIPADSTRTDDDFAAVMARFNALSEDEERQLRENAQRTELGYEAFELGQEYLERGEYASARRWLRKAARHHIPGAEECLQQLTLCQTTDQPPRGWLPQHDRDVDGVEELAHKLVIDASLRPCPAGAPQESEGAAPWAAALKHRHAEQVTAVARKEAARIIEQARSDADAVLDGAKHKALAIIEDAQAEAAQILSDAREGTKSALGAARKRAVSPSRRLATATSSVGLLLAAGSCRQEPLPATAWHKLWQAGTPTAAWWPGDYTEMPQNLRQGEQTWPDARAAMITSLAPHRMIQLLGTGCSLPRICPTSWIMEWDRPDLWDLPVLHVERKWADFAAQTRQPWPTSTCSPTMLLLADVAIMLIQASGPDLVCLIGPKNYRLLDGLTPSDTGSGGQTASSAPGTARGPDDGRSGPPLASVVKVGTPALS